MFRIAMDGTAAAGKGTLAKGVSKLLGFMYVDTGAMYRGVALHAIRQNISLSDGVSHGKIASQLEYEFKWDGDTLSVFINGEDVTNLIREEAVGAHASISSGFSEVRDALLSLQREIGTKQNIIMDGRDIGSVVLPDAELKVYVDANIEVRAQRRFVDVHLKDPNSTVEGVLQDLIERDSRDKTRAIAPLVCVSDAKILDTTHQSIEAGIVKVCTWYFEHCNEIEASELNAFHQMIKKVKSASLDSSVADRKDYLIEPNKMSDSKAHFKQIANVQRFWVDYCFAEELR